MNAASALHYPFDDTPPAGTVFPVAPGIGWVRMPLPFALDHINVWLLDDGDRLAAIDSGVDTAEIRAHWDQALSAERRPLARVIVTHCHPDHVGLASWLAARDRGQVLMTLGEYFGAHAIWGQTPGYAIPDMVAQFAAHGLEDRRLAAFNERGNTYRRGAPELPDRYHRLFDGDRIAIGGHDWRVIVGYGHSPEHASLYCEALGVLVSGDMLLPRISTNISLPAAMPTGDPLGWFLDSLRVLRNLPDNTLVLPSHGRPFRGIHARVDQLIAHHRDRCDELVAACGSPRSAAELLSTLFPRELDTHQVMFAMGEAIAHLNHLEQQGRLRRMEEGDGAIRYITTR